jgi:hypothetical protein
MPQAGSANVGPSVALWLLLTNKMECDKRCLTGHLGVNEYHPVHHGFDYYYGAPMTQNECVSNIHTPGSATDKGAFGPCPIYNGSTTEIKVGVGIDEFMSSLSSLFFLSGARVS